MPHVSVRDPETDTKTGESGTAAGSSMLRPLLVLAAAAGVMLAGSVALWVRYGTAVFYEMIAAGLAACL